MLSWFIEKLKTMSLWHLLWMAVLLVEISVVVLDAVMSQLLWGSFSFELFKINIVISFASSLFVGFLVILLVDGLRRSERAAENEVRELNRELERRVAERTEQLVKAQKMEAVGRLAGGIAHDFNNLLTVIQGDCELALSEVHGNDTVRFSLNQIQKASLRASALTRKRMLFSRQKPMAPVRLELNNL